MLREGDRAREGENTIVWGTEEGLKKYEDTLCYGLMFAPPLKNSYVEVMPNVKVFEIA